MFTSSAQYFALLPSYICTLQVYAFCNTHDVTWGTKGDNVIHTDLGAAKTVGGAAGTVEVEMPSEQLDIDSGYDEALRNLRDRLEVPKPLISENQAQEDYYRGVRTYMVAVWMVCNAILAMAVSEAYSSTDVANNFYLKFILWSVASVALFRAIGSSAFIVMNVVAAIVEGRIQAKFEKVFGGGDEKGGWGGRGRFGVGAKKAAKSGGSSNKGGSGGTVSDGATTVLSGSTKKTESTVLSSVSSALSGAGSRVSEVFSGIGRSKG